MYDIPTDKTNLDLLEGETVQEARRRLKLVWGNFVGHMPHPGDFLERYEDKWIFRADLAPAGLKAFAAEKLIANIETDAVTYVAPRVGHAPDAIAALAQMYGKRAIMFIPACKELSPHQRALLAYPNVELKFFKIAAMPVLNKYAREWSEEFGATFIPFGLSKTPVITAGLMNMCDRLTERLGQQPSAAVMAVSTGTMIRGLQIGWPDAAMFGVAVARNLKKGEIGRGMVCSHHLPFLSNEVMENQPPFESTSNYDAKAWRTFVDLDIPESVFINVGSDAHITRNAASVADKPVDSLRDWKDMRDWTEDYLA